MEDHERNRLLNRLIDGSISPDDFVRVQNLLRNDPELRQEYYDLLAVDQLLVEAYEVPDYIAVHAQAMDDSWAVRRVRRGMMTRALLAAAAVLMAAVGTFVFIRARQPEVRLSGSSDSHYVIDGVVGNGEEPEIGESIELKHGVLNVALGPYVEACIEAPALFHLRDRSGTIHLDRGSAFFQIAPGGKGFEVHTPGGVIRDIGTKFGVRVSASGRVETHVASGLVDIERTPGAPIQRVSAGEAVAWTRTENFVPKKTETDGFLQSLPIETPLLVDDFNAPNGTPMGGRMPRTGLAWSVQRELGTSVIRSGALDTSYGPRTISAHFAEGTSGSQRSVFVATLTTRTPEQTADKSYRHDAAESITLLGSDGSAVFSLVARASRDHRWQLRDDSNGRLSIGTRVSALSEHTLTLSYEQESGMVRLFDGPSTQANLLDELRVASGVALGSISVSNDEGGDVALDSLSVRLVRYPQKRLSSD